MGEPIVRIVGDVAAAALGSASSGGAAAGVRPFLSREAVTGVLGFRSATVDGWVTSGKVVAHRVGEQELFPLTMHQPLATKAKAITSGRSLDPTSFATIDQLATESGVGVGTIQKRIGKAGLATPFLDDAGMPAWERSVLTDAGVLAPGRSTKVRPTPPPGEPAAGAADAEVAAAKLEPATTIGPPKADATARINSELEHAGNGVRAFFGHRGVQRGIAAGAILATPSLGAAGMAAAVRNSGADQAQERSMTTATELVLATAGVAMGMRGVSQAHRVFGYTLAAGAAIPLGKPIVEIAAKEVG